jgi:hypothetical protein
MENNYVDVAATPLVQSLVIYQKDNNLDQKDNLDLLPAEPAVYAVCGRINNQAANPRYVGETDNLQEAIKSHFDPKRPAPEGNECFKAFMLSIKIKALIYELLPDSSGEERANKREEWVKKHKPTCNEALNEIH